MNTYTVSFFGHREVSQAFAVEKRLKNVINELLRTHDCVEFLVGRDGEFDQMVASTVRSIEREQGYGNSLLVLVLPYMKAEYRDNQQSYLDYYNEIEVCEESSKAHYKSAIQIRNRTIVDRSDLVVCCIQHKSSGAYKTVQYAKRKHCQILNVAENI